MIESLYLKIAFDILTFKALGLWDTSLIWCWCQLHKLDNQMDFLVENFDIHVYVCRMQFNLFCLTGYIYELIWWFMVLNVRTITMVSIKPLKLYTMLGSKDQTISILGQALSFYNNMAPIVALKISTFRTLSASTTWKTYHEVSRYIQETNGMYTIFFTQMLWPNISNHYLCFICSL